uniref:VWFA domain-containing protein n=1 Tax=Oryzias latipes TaxID=8090 RepID=A0A3P9LL54_ORYLA
VHQCSSERKTQENRQVWRKDTQQNIVFLVDGSINLGRSNFEAVMQFINSMIDNLYDDESSLQISLAQYAADVTDAFFLNTYDNKENIVTAIEQVQYRGGPRINTGAAIRHIQNVHFTKERGSRMDQGVPQILMVVTGGASADDSRTASLALQRKGIRVYAVGAGNIQTELEGIASESTTVARSSNFQAISDLVELLMPALTEELKGQKLCVTESLTPRCKYNVDIDIAFLIDSSESTYRSFFTSIKQYIAHIVEHLYISSDPTSSVHHARVSVVQHAPYSYSQNKTGSPIHVDIGLTEQHSAQTFVKVLLEKTQQLEGGLALATAIESTVEQVFEKAPVPRDRKVLMLFVTGSVAEEKEQLLRIATEIKCRGFFLVIFAVGQTLTARDFHVLSLMASEPSDVFFKQLDTLSAFYSKRIQEFGQFLPKYISSKF